MPEVSSHEEILTQTLATCLNLNKPKSFFLYAGAGTGKTRAVVQALHTFRDSYGTQFRQSGQRVGVITYTNAACDEIRQRIDFDPIFVVSTIHSFAWEQIHAYHNDIRSFLRKRLTGELNELRRKQASGRPGTATANARDAQIKTKESRLQNLGSILQFTYNPNGENVGKDSLNHAEVIACITAFLDNKRLFQEILVTKYPVLFIDESQDTQKDLVCALIKLQEQLSTKFILGLFGDGMQRIYADGKIGLENDVPPSWETPSLVINHRCPKRVVTLINLIRSEVDNKMQQARAEAPEGIVRLFLIDEKDDLNKNQLEKKAAVTMAELTSDTDWLNPQAVKVLTLEHHMAARRCGFDCFFDPLYKINDFKTGLLDGTLSGIAFLSQQVLPLVNALDSKDTFAVASILKKHSPLMTPDRLNVGASSVKKILNARRSVECLRSLWKDDDDPVLLEILRVINNESLFDIPDILVPILSYEDFREDKAEALNTRIDIDENPKVDAWRDALSVPFSQFEAYVEYVSDKSNFGTHQGIKGLQFPRVMVILDDNDARGFMFNYDKFLGAKALTATDMKNLNDGKEISVDRTRRLFYTTCSRAQESLAVVVYTTDTGKVVQHVSSHGWFKNEEVVRL